MGYSEKFRRKLEAQINAGKSHKDRVILSFRAGFYVLTKPVGDSISAEYDLIDEAIKSLDSKDKLMPMKKHELIQLKRQVPKRYGISNKVKEELQDIINDILGKKRNDANY
jgi:hypothetical protein